MDRGSFCDGMVDGVGVEGGRWRLVWGGLSGGCGGV